MAITIPIVASPSGAQSTVTLAAPVVNTTGAVPTAPACISAKAGTATNSVTLNWSDSVFAAGTTNRRYELHEDLYSADHIVTTVTVPTRTSGALAAAAYRYFVIPMDSNGAGPASPKVTVTVPVTALVDSPVGCAGAPPPPPPPPPPPGIPALWNASPPAGVCPMPSGSIVGTDSFDRAPLATTEWWDNFDGAAGSSPDSRLWLEDTQNQGGSQVYDPAHSFLDGSSHAVLEATRASSGQVTSGRFTSRTKVNVQYGWHAARVKFPSFVGQFPALWMLFVGYNTQPGNYGEIDMMEFFGPATAYSTHLHFGGSITSIASDKDVPASQGEDAGNAYHTYWMLWEPNKIQIGVDDLSMGTWPPPNASDWGHFNQPFYWIMNFAVGPHGGYIPTPAASSFPARMLIDWVWSKPLALL